MSGFGGIVGLVILVIVGIPAMIAMVVFRQVKAFGRSDLQLVPANRNRFASAIADSQSHDAWFVAQGFDIVACSTLSALRTALITAWQHRDRLTYICIYHVANQRNYDIVTRFNNDIMLTTGSTADGMLLPEPDACYTQCFPNTTLSRIWQKHSDAEQYLLSEGATLATNSKPFAEVFIDTVRRHSEHVQTIPFWPLRGLYWYFIRRGQLSGKSVRQLVAAGVYPQPVELLHR